MTGDEQVLVVPTRRLFPGSVTPHGFIAEGVEAMLDRIERNKGFVCRGQVESDPSMKQIIPYCYLRWDQLIFLMRRFQTQAESRLHHMLSIGVGGHINPDEPGTGSIVIRGAKRELAEEVEVLADHSIRLTGYLNDDSNPVGRVHFGLVFEVTLGGPSVRIRETDLMDGRFVPIADLEHVTGDMESWSRILTEHLLKSAGQQAQ